MSYSKQFWYLILTSSVIACASQTSRAGPVSPNAPIREVRSDSSALTTVLHTSIYQPGNQRFDVQLKSTVQSTTGDSIPRVDSSWLTAVISAQYFLTGDQKSSIRANVEADSIKLVSSTVGASGKTLPRELFTVSVDTTNGRGSVIPSREECSDSSNSLFHGDEVTPVVGVQSFTLQRWTDSSSYALCRGGILLRAIRISVYQQDSISTRRSSDTLIQIIRTTEIQFVGSGSQFLQPVQATGYGRSVDTLVIQQEPLRLSRISGTANLELEFQSPLRHQRFTQKTSSQFVRR
jgi:hypothetical protein